MQLRNKKLSTSRWVPGKTLLLVKWEDHTASTSLKNNLLSEAIKDDGQGTGTVHFLSAGFYVKEVDGALVITETMEANTNPYVGMVRTIIATDIVELKVL